MFGHKRTISSRISTLGLSDSYDLTVWMDTPSFSATNQISPRFT